MAWPPWRNTTAARWERGRSTSPETFRRKAYSRKRRTSMFPILLFLAAAPIQNIEVHGNKTVAPQVISAISGLKPGQTADKPDFDLACARIVRTGFFTNCNYTFAPNANHGYNVTFDVEEVERTQTVRLEIPGLDKEKFQAQEPLLGSVIPNSDVAVQTYVLALQRFLKTKET